jgi:hypothetical protein
MTSVVVAEIAGGGRRCRGDGRNVAGMFASPLGYVLRLVPCRISEDGEMLSSDRSASTPYVLFVAGSCGAGCWWVRGAISRGRVGKNA